jgi:hypothetical protein
MPFNVNRLGGKMVTVNETSIIGEIEVVNKSGG